MRWFAKGCHTLLSSFSVSELSSVWKTANKHKVLNGLHLFFPVFSQRIKIVTFVMSPCLGRQLMTSDTKPGKTSKSIIIICLFFNLLDHLYMVWTVLCFFAPNVDSLFATSNIMKRRWKQIKKKWTGFLLTRKSNLYVFLMFSVISIKAEEKLVFLFFDFKKTQNFSDFAF